MSIAEAMKKPLLQTFGIFPSTAEITFGDVEDMSPQQIWNLRGRLHEIVEYLDKKSAEIADDKIRMLEIELEIANRKIAAQEESE